MKNICVIGSLNMDLVVNVDTMPKPGQTIIGSNFKEVPGGKGANQAVAMARLNGNVSQFVKDAVNAALSDGIRNHNYLSFRGYYTEGSVCIGDNYYFNSMN